MRIKLLKLVNLILATSLNAKLVSAQTRPDLSAYQISRRPTQPKYLNIGAGKWSHVMWHNLDNPSDGYDKSFGLRSERKKMIKHDLMSEKRLPVEECTVKAVYSSHVVEHLNDAANKFLFSEVYRILFPGGFFRVTCPDMNLFLRMYERGDTKLLAKLNGVEEGKYSKEQMFLNMFFSSLSDLTPKQGIDKVSSEEFKKLNQDHGAAGALNILAKRVPDHIVSKFPRNHDSWQSESKLIMSLKNAGFSDVYVSRHLQSECEEMRDPAFFDYMHPYESLYVEAVK